MIPEKECTMCKEPKKIYFFHPKKKAPDGRHNECIDCRNIIEFKNDHKRMQERELLNKLMIV